MIYFQDNDKNAKAMVELIEAVKFFAKRNDVCPLCLVSNVAEYMNEKLTHEGSHEEIIQ